MATGSGKTVTAITAVYRLVKFAGAERVLFLVDRANLGRQALKEFQGYATPDDGRKFTDLYNVQLLQTDKIAQSSKVCITTIQRLYAMLQGQPDYNLENEERLLFEISEILAGRDPLPSSTTPPSPSKPSTSSSSTSATAPSTTSGARSWSTSTAS